MKKRRDGPFQRNRNYPAECTWQHYITLYIPQCVHNFMELHAVPS